jgi:hypothetical protein
MTSPITNAVDGVTLVTEVVLTWGRVFFRQRNENPKALGFSYLSTDELPVYNCRVHVQELEFTEGVDVQKKPKSKPAQYSPIAFRYPPGKPLNPEELLAELFGGLHPPGVG